MRKWIVYITTVTILWLSIVPTHEYMHCLLLWGSGFEGECTTSFQQEYTHENGFAITEREYHFGTVDQIGHHVAIYTLNLIQLVLLPLALWPKKSDVTKSP